MNKKLILDLSELKEIKEYVPLYRLRIDDSKKQISYIIENEEEVLCLPKEQLVELVMQGKVLGMKYYKDQDKFRGTPALMLKKKTIALTELPTVGYNTFIKDYNNN